MNRGRAYRRFSAQDVPSGLRAAVETSPAAEGVNGGLWLDRLPALVGDALQTWDLHVDGDPRHGAAALVLPVRRPTGEPAALKVVWPHPEARQEHLALRAWAGQGSVRLLAADPARWTLLLERLDGDRDLHSVPVMESCGAIGALLAELDRPAAPWAPRLSDHLHELVGDIDRAEADPQWAHRFPRSLLQVARSTAAEQGRSADIDAHLVHTDLHQANVLWSPTADRWLAIDPKPMAARPAFAVAPSVRNRWAEAQESRDLRQHLALRVEAVCEPAGIDVDEARAR